MIELKNICYRYPDGTEALKDITISIEAGEKIAFLGHNGSGKSTLFLVMNGIYRPQSGEYRFRGARVSFGGAGQRSLFAHIGLVFQDPDVQLFASSVYQEIAFGPANLGLPEAEVRGRVESSMGKTDTEFLRDRPTHFLSYGEKKRVSIADIIAMEGSVIMFDEPLAWVDIPHKKRLVGIMNDLSGGGKTVIISTHDPDLAYAWADRVFILKGGRILAQGAPGAVFSDEAALKEAELEQPFILSLSKKLKLKKIPRSREELLSMIGT